MRQGNAFLLHVYACHAGGLTIKRALLPLGTSKERGWWKDAMPQRRGVLLGSRGRWWRRTWAAGPRSGVRSRGVSEDLQKDITQAYPLLLCREAPDTTLLSPPSVPNQHASRRAQPYLHFQQRSSALTEGAPWDSRQTSLSLVSRRGGGTGASRGLNHCPPHARHWTGPSLFTSHDNLDTGLHVLIQPVRHWWLERFRDLSKVKQQAKGNEAQINSCVATWGTCHCPQRALWTLVPMYHCTQFRVYQAQRPCWVLHRLLGLFRRLTARPPGKMTSRLHWVEHNDYIQISHVQIDVWLTRPLL